LNHSTESLDGIGVFGVRKGREGNKGWERRGGEGSGEF